MDTLTCRFRSAIILVAICLTQAGCGASGPTKYPVSGKVTYRGRAVPTGSVMFVPEDGPAAVGPISADGSYRLEAVLGKHRVGIMAIPQPPPGTHERDNVPLAEPLVPAKYNRADLSGLGAEVRPGVENAIDFNLK